MCLHRVYPIRHSSHNRGFGYRMSWNDRWMEVAEVVATWSKDTSTKVGAVIVNERNTLLSLGWNGYPRGVDDSIAERQERPDKYRFTEHAERNAIYNAASTGTSLSGGKIYIPWFPCSDCARAIIQSGILTVVCKKPDAERDIRWIDDFNISNQMLKEAGINIEYV